MLDVSWQDCAGLKSYSNFFLHMACVESMVLAFHGVLRIQRWVVQYLIVSTWWCSCPSTQMRLLMISRHVEGKWWWGVMIICKLVLFGQNNFGFIIANSVNKGSHLQVWHVLSPFCYGCITSCMFTFHTYLNYIMGWKYVVHVHAEFWMVGLY